MTFRSGLRLLRRLVAAAAVIVVLVVLVTAFRVWWTGRQDNLRPAQAIVVLGASQFNGRPSQIFEHRLAHAHRLWTDQVSAQIVTVGGSRPGDRYTEAAAGRTWLIAQGVPASDVLAVQTGNDTYASLKAVHTALTQHGWTKVTIVTDPWHMLRAQSMAHDLGIDSVGSPVTTGPAVRHASTVVRYVARETLAYLFYEVFGSSPEPGPPAA